jgi:hypothetical protein
LRRWSFVPHAAQEASANSQSATEEKLRVRRAVAELQQRMIEKKKTLDEKGISDSQEALEELARKAEKIESGSLENQKDALVKLNDLSKAVQERRNELLPTEKLQQQLAGLKQLENGPGEKLADQLRDGKLGEAAKEMRKLLEKMQQGDLPAEDREKLANQLEKVQQKLQQMVQDHEARKADQKEKIEQQRQQGNEAEAAKLQEELERLQAQDEQMKQGAQQMAEKLGQAARNLKEGKEGDAANELQELAEQLEGMQEKLEELESLEEALNEIDDAKQAMGCKQCQGAGCKACEGQGQAQGQGQGKNGPPGGGLGEGRGFGARPEEENATKGYESRVRAKPKQGSAVRVGDVGGPNLPGKMKETMKEQLEAALAQEPDPVDEQALPRDQRAHSKEYFEKLLSE